MGGGCICQGFHLKINYDELLWGVCGGGAVYTPKKCPKLGVEAGKGRMETGDRELGAPWGRKCGRGKGEKELETPGRGDFAAGDAGGGVQAVAEGEVRSALSLVSLFHIAH